MVDLCPVVKWSDIQMVVGKPDWKKPLLDPKCVIQKDCQVTLLNCLNTRLPKWVWIRYLGVRCSDGYFITYKFRNINKEKFSVPNYYDGRPKSRIFCMFDPQFERLLLRIFKLLRISLVVMDFFLILWLMFYDRLFIT